MWLWRKIERIRWQDYIINEEVLYKICDKRSIKNSIIRKQKNWIENIPRENNLLKDELNKIRLRGKKRKEKSRKKCQISSWEELKTYVEMKRLAEDRKS